MHEETATRFIELFLCSNFLLRIVDLSTLMGQPAFVVRLIPMFSLKADFLFDQINHLMITIDDATGIIYLDRVTT